MTIKGSTQIPNWLLIAAIMAILSVGGYVTIIKGQATDMADYKQKTDKNITDIAVTKAEVQALKESTDKSLKDIRDLLLEMRTDLKDH